MEKRRSVNGSIIIGLTENIELISSNGNKEELVAKVDTGATKSSIDTRLATKLKLGPVTRTKMVKSAHGHQMRPVIEAEIMIAGKKIKAEFTLADRTHMRYQVLVGVNILKNGFLIDPSKKQIK
jgi:hypothetical protein|tara:strand:+ start:9145 stop:9516 length:372 start_codon:yes stop_codon:yes gene_type:complete